MTSVISLSTQSSSLSSLSFPRNPQTEAVLPLLSPQQVPSSRNTRHVINCNHSCHKPSSNGNLSNNITHPNIIRNHLSRKPKATPTNIPKALFLSPPLPARRIPTNPLTSRSHLKGSTNRSLSSDHYNSDHSILNEYSQEETSFQSINSTIDKSSKLQLPVKSKKSLHFTLLSKCNEFNSDELLCTKNDRNHHLNINANHKHHLVSQLDKEEYSHHPSTFRWNHIFVKLFNWFQRIQTTNNSRTSSSDRSTPILIHNNKYSTSTNSCHYQVNKFSEHTRSRSQPAEKFAKIKSNLCNNDSFVNDCKKSMQSSREILSSNRNTSASEFDHNNSKKDFVPIPSLLVPCQKSVESLVNVCEMDQFPVVLSNSQTSDFVCNNNTISKIDCNLLPCKKYSCSCSIMSFNDLINSRFRKRCSENNEITCFCSHSCPISSHHFNEIPLDSQLSSSSCVSDCCFCQRYLNYCVHCRIVPFSSKNGKNDRNVQSSHHHQQHYHYYYCNHYHQSRQHHHISHDSSQHHIVFTNHPPAINTDCTNYQTQKKAPRNFHLNLENQYATIGQFDQVRYNPSDCSKSSPPSKQTDCSSPVITLQCLNVIDKRLTRWDNICNTSVISDSTVENDAHLTNSIRNISSNFKDYNQQCVHNHENEDENMIENKEVTNGISSKTCSNLANIKSPSERVPSLNFSKIGTTTTSVNQKFVSDLMNLKRTGWYWGPLTVEEAKLLLKNCSDGTFLVRDSSHDSYMLSVSFRAGGQIYHTRFEHLAGKFSLAMLNDLNKNVSSSVAECIERVMADSFQDRMHFLPTLENTSPSSSITNPNVQFISHHPHQHDQQPQSQHLESTRRSTSSHIKASLLHPLSRFLIVPSLVHLCRFELLLHVRHDHIDLLPLPPNILRYLKENQYYAEIIPAYLELLGNINTNNSDKT
ncbi:Suppressor of cytokine signaling 7 [Schistosoma japonicum]|uniref:Suppressor of cytokine signaling 7 n=1 Tax=Schistosoma japonicum TaxID=6182 RepID=A0A4Z2D947_SCHJA|nr:Suppressor of cytokine signaling 7 [Schistosoma japonicum]